MKQYLYNLEYDKETKNIYLSETLFLKVLKVVLFIVFVIPLLLIYVYSHIIEYLTVLSVETGAKNRLVKNSFDDLTKSQKQNLKKHLLNQ